MRIFCGVSAALASVGRSSIKRQLESVKVNAGFPLPCPLLRREKARNERRKLVREDMNEGEAFASIAFRFTVTPWLPWLAQRSPSFDARSGARWVAANSLV